MRSPTERQPSSHSITGDLSKLLKLKESSGKRADMYRLVRGMKYLRNAWMTYREPLILHRKQGQKIYFWRGIQRAAKKRYSGRAAKGRGFGALSYLHR